MLMRTDPFRDLDRLTQQVLGGLGGPSSVPMDAYREGDRFIVHVDIPGVDADSIDLTVEKDVLTIRAERKPAAEGTEMLLSERPHGSFTRRLFLGDSLDADRIEARYDAGVLTLQLPVAEKAKPRRVAITRGDAPPEPIEAHASEDRAPTGVAA